ncbi:PspA/IM30 family protein [Agarilytica rhodophyticola]|uniref:PspA/IM30 family protein n=1 Tax=Agarilytica rhodophyticola TaxID=1737490 RepID=UPI000B348E5E|nr:PspA/IM30 family protein [Agarilytica rhodophyticola]
MSILKDIFTAIKGGANEVGEAVVDSQALRILEQEIREADEGINKAKVQLRNLKSKEIKLQRELNALKDEEAQYTTKAKQCKDAGNEALARECIDKILELRDSIASFESEYQMLKSSVDNIYKVIKQREKTIEKNRNELEKAKTIKELNKVKSAVASAMPTNDSSAKRVNRALDRVKRQEEEFNNKQSADTWFAEQEAGGDLDRKLKEAGIGGSGKSAADDLFASL